MAATISTRIVDSATARIVLDALAQAGHFGPDAEGAPRKVWTPEISGAITSDTDSFMRLNPCHRCGGSGNVGIYWVEGGVCFECEGANTSKRVSRVCIKAHARAMRVSWKKHSVKAAKRAADVEKMLAGQRKWCSENGYGAITFDERAVIKAAEAEKNRPALVADAKVLAAKYLDKVIEAQGTVEKLVQGEGDYGTWYLVKLTLDGIEAPVSWLTSAEASHKFPVGSRVNFKGRVKKVAEFNNQLGLDAKRCTLKEVV